MYTNSKTPKGPQQEPFLLRTDAKSAKNKPQKPTPQNHARLLLEMYPKRKALKIAKQYLKRCKLNSKKHRLWAGVFWILSDLGPLPKEMA